MAAAAKVPKFVYRYLRERDHALALLEGRVWLSTLEGLRRGDHPRGDVDEGTYRLAVTDYHTEDKSAEAEKVRQRLAPMVSMEGAVNCSVTNVKYTNQLIDAYVMCTSTVNDKFMRDRFGEHCVRISDLIGFVTACGNSLAQHIGEDAIAFWGAMDYCGRNAVDAMGPEMTNLAFMNVKGNASEKEYRLLWSPKRFQPLTSFLLHVPEAARYTSIV
jgi:hypothetical protein